MTITDLCYRARKMRIHSMMTPDVRIIHYRGASDPLLSAKMTQLISGKAPFHHEAMAHAQAMAGIALLELLVQVRKLLTSAMAAVTASPCGHVAAQKWRHVWMGRSRWTKGYPHLTRSR